MRASPRTWSYSSITFLPYGQNLALNHAKTRQQALDALEVAAPYELGFAYSLVLQLGQIYIRSMCEEKPTLRRIGGSEAAAEFSENPRPSRDCAQRNLSARLAHLQLGRAYAMAGLTLPRRAAPGVSGFSFLRLWKRGRTRTFPIFKQSQGGIRKTCSEILRFRSVCGGRAAAGRVAASRGKHVKLQEQPFKTSSQSCLQRPGEVLTREELRFLRTGLLIR